MPPRRAAAATKPIAKVSAAQPETSKKPRGRPTGKRTGDTGVMKPSKRQKISHISHCSVAGVVLALGQGDVGQLGMGEDVMERSKPSLVKIADPVVQVVAGGMHTVCLTDKGQVYTFGCNDEGALGRDTSEDGSEMSPAKVDLSEKIVQVSAGDSHTAAITDDGRLYIWGSFRDSTGIIGLVKPFAVIKEPMELLPDVSFVKVASGADHLAVLTAEGDIYTVGNSEQGQLGRVAECFCVRGGRKGLDTLISPHLVRFKKLHGKSPKFVDIWSGTYVTFAKEAGGKIYGWGLNNYYQLGVGDMANRFVPILLHTYEGRDWKAMASGLHHSLAMDSDGRLYVTGRAEYGRLGLGADVKTEKTTPTPITTLNGTKCSTISCGGAVSLAVTADGQCMSWGMGTNGQLGHQGDEDAYVPGKMLGKQLDGKRVIQVAGGGQHVVLLARAS